MDYTTKKTNPKIILNTLSLWLQWNHMASKNRYQIPIITKKSTSNQYNYGNLHQVSSKKYQRKKYSRS
jgi:hypothetical protein